MTPPQHGSTGAHHRDTPEGRPGSSTPGGPEGAPGGDPEIRAHDPYGPRPLDRGSPLPLWAQLLADLRRRMDAGAFTEEFPAEHRLTGEYEVSRHTVREALRKLRADGLVIAERGRASRLDTRRIQQPLGSLYSLFRDLEAQGVEQRSEVLRLERTADATVAGHLGVVPDAPLVVLERLRLADGEPLAHDTAYLPADIAEPLLDADFGHTSLYGELARRCGVKVSGGRERIAPFLPDIRQAWLLGLADREAAFAIERLGRAGERPVEWRETVVRGDRFAFVAEWSDASRAVALAPRAAAPSA
ncbi:GntR family transcriptional regulator [Streptomyces sp. NRRL F-4489]|uniref:GntR family transcriptional regulator n=1 Tax=Streptomyces sp. NRRL F-4489 TaxID=1609095 RepID=UPI000AA3D35B|nr:GntR family transcriptional regulator [Streptomyces sp. NRRL F-4489]